MKRSNQLVNLDSIHVVPSSSAATCPDVRGHSAGLYRFARSLADGHPPHVRSRSGHPRPTASVEEAVRDRVSGMFAEREGRTVGEPRS